MSPDERVTPETSDTRERDGWAIELGSYLKALAYECDQDDPTRQMLLQHVERLAALSSEPTEGQRPFVEHDEVGFVLHSGDRSPFRINADALDDETLHACAAWLAEKLPPFGEVVGIPEGGLRLAKAMEAHATEGPVLIVDDVLTTGRSMETEREGHEIGAVLFARGPCPEWITPLFRTPEPTRPEGDYPGDDDELSRVLMEIADCLETGEGVASTEDANTIRAAARRLRQSQGGERTEGIAYRPGRNLAWWKFVENYDPGKFERYPATLTIHRPEPTDTREEA